MSFVRVGRPQQQHTKGKRPVRHKKAAAPKKDWVSTVNDLSVHKLTPAELSHRHEIHKSHNKAAAQWELREKALQRRFRHAGSPARLDHTSLSIIREVFSDQLLLQDVLARSDKAMAVVKDLFGDAPRRQTGHPSVTMAPNCDSDSELPVLQKPDPPTQLSLLSQSMMDQQALNELEASEGNCSDEDACPAGSSDYHVIKRANIRKMKAQFRGRVQRQKVGRPNSELADRENVPVTPCTSGRAPGQTALNATVAVRRVRSRQSHLEEDKEEPSVMVSQVLNPDLPLNQSGRLSSHRSRNKKCVSQSSELDGSSVASLSGDQSSLGLLQAMLGQVEADLDTLSPDTEPAAAQNQKQHRTQGLTGFSVALVSTLGRLVHLLKQREEEAEKEARERRRLEEELREQRGLIDALTAESMTLREEAAVLQAELQHRTVELEQKLDTVVLVMGGLGLLEAHTDLPQDSNVKAAVCQAAPVAERDPEQLQASVSPAVLLSPPRQRDNWQQSPVTHPVPLDQGRPPVDVLHSCEDVPSHSSASSLTSLPLTSLPSTSSLSLVSDPLSSRLSPEAVLAEIAQLSRQNDLIRAQLSQAKGPESGVRESPNEQKRSSSSSTRRVTPQSMVERRTSASSSTGGRSQHVQAVEREQLTNQATSPNTLHVGRVEERLLELNRQSAAARGRLLELIEQQKQSVSSKVSPSGSPIPPSAFSPHSAAGGGSPELLPAQEMGDSGERRCAGSEASSHSLRGETKDGKTQTEKRREREGWFALSAHVR
ncbi:spindle and centriole-associated protein 1 [Centropristis striata]|uniref:spindle and centriole-associated protein 1 n=1 Tax=Centropristis striata TaxID=184440 RepID=UPI0027E015B1|nr:spindle and centriole-associated protein 1 [Centropristis striata]